MGSQGMRLCQESLRAPQQGSRIPGLALASQPHSAVPACIMGRLGGTVYPSWTSTPSPREAAAEEKEGKRAGQRCRGAEARSGLAGSGWADGRLSCQGPRLAVQTASFLYGNEEFRLMELNHL